MQKTAGKRSITCHLAEKLVVERHGGDRKILCSTLCNDH
jgi:hypothetical protein